MATESVENQLALPEGLVAVVKRDCPTCTLLEPVFAQLADARPPLTIYSQDDPGFPESVENVIDDRELEKSFRLRIETVPTLLRIERGREVGRIVGWKREDWESFTGVEQLGPELPPYRPGCGSRSVEPGLAEELEVRFGHMELHSRRIQLPPLEDEHEHCYDAGWTDGLPVVPPAEARVVRMLKATNRPPDEVVGKIPPDLVDCTIEKIAVNAVMAGCLPEYLPVVIAAVEAALEDDFCMHGLLATTWFSGPVVLVNGPIAKAIGMNSGGNCLGQGNRANATIGRALQLVIRNVGGGKPGGVDRATFGNPGKYTFCFAENEQESPWEPLSESRGVPQGASAVTLFGGDGVQGVFDQQSREPESLSRSFAASLLAVGHPKMAMLSDAMLVVSPEHVRVFARAGWSRERLIEEITELTTRPGAELIRGAGGIAEGLPESLNDAILPKFRPGGLHIVCAGGTAGLFSAIIGGWVASGPMGSTAVTKGIRP